MSTFDRFQTCLLCGSQQIRPLKGYQDNYLVECGVCKFVFCQRKPTAEELEAHYDLYPRRNFISAVTAKRYGELLNKFEKYRSTNNLIDVGCGDGLFLVEAKKRNWNVFGTEFTKEAMEVCSEKGIRMTSSPLAPENYPPDFFDIITSFEVIEHINDPVSEILSFYQILRKGGLVYITTPNFDSVSRNIVGPRWNVIEYPEHLSYYTRRTLNKLLNKRNFHKVEIYTTGISLSRIQISSGASILGNGNTNWDENLRQKADDKLIFRWLKSGINFLLNASGKGDSIKAFFLKH